MRLSINKEILKKVAVIGWNYQLLVNVFIALVYITCVNALDEELNLNIQKISLIIILWEIAIPPIWEELFFRKYLYTKLKSKFNINKAIFISSLIFALVHFNLVSAVFAYGIGVISCKVYEKTGEIKYSIVLHSSCNLVTSIFHNLIKFNIFNESYNLDILQIMLTIVLLLGIVFYKKYTSRLLESI